MMAERRIRMSVLTLVLTIFWLVPAIPQAQAATHGVNCASNPAALKTALATAGATDTILIVGVCDGPISIAASFTGLTLQGMNETAAIDGLAKGTTLTVAAGATVTVRSLTITGGRGPDGAWNSGNPGGAGGISNAGTLALVDSVVSGNAGGVGGDATYGNGGSGGAGGINSTGTLTVSGTTVRGNAGGVGEGSIYGNVGSGGAGGIYSTGTLTVSGTTVRGNAGGGAYYGIYGNGGSGGAGGIYSAGAGSITNSTITGNTGGPGAVSFYANGGSGGTGGVDLGAGSLTASTVSANTGGPGNVSYGGGIPGAPGPGGIKANGATARATIVAGNAPSDCSGTVTTSGYLLVGNGTGCTITAGAGNQLGTAGSPVDPKLARLSDNGGLTQTMGLRSTSPARDVIPPASCVALATDQRGVPRPQGTNCDIGAFEALAGDATAPTAAPVVTPTPNGAGWNNSSVSIEWNWTDGTGSGIDPEECTTSSASSVEGNPVHVAVTCRDLAGNLGNAAVDLMVDKQAPSASITSGPSGPTSSTGASFAFTGSDPENYGSGVGHFECALDGGAFSDCTSPKVYSSLAEGSTHVFVVRAVDAAGNVTDPPASRSWSVDTIAPDTTVDTSPAAVSNSASAVFGYSSTEAGSTFECDLDGGGFSSCGAGGKTYGSLADGPHTFQVRSIDPAGNTDASPASHTWTVDATGPTTTILSGPSGTVTETTATFTFSSDDPAATFRCSLDGAPYSDCTSPKAYPGLADGPHSFRVKAKDAVGNTGEDAVRTWQIGPLPHLPDGMIKLSAAPTYLGGGIYNTTGAGQSAAKTISLWATATYSVNVHNDGTHPDQIALKGCASAPGFTVTYKVGRLNVTAQVVAGTYRTPLLAVGAAKILTAKIRASSALARGTTLTCAITASSVGDATRTDVVNATATVP